MSSCSSFSHPNAPRYCVDSDQPSLPVSVTIQRGAGELTHTSRSAAPRAYLPLSEPRLLHARALYRSTPPIHSSVADPSTIPAIAPPPRPVCACWPSTASARLFAVGAGLEDTLGGGTEDDELDG